MKPIDIVAFVCGVAYLLFLRWAKQNTEQFNRAVLNRMSDFMAVAYPDVAVPGTEDYQDEVPEPDLHIEGLDDA